MSQRRSIIKHPHEYAGAPQILSPAEGFGERFDPSFLKGVGSTSISSAGPNIGDYNASSSTAGAGTSGSSGGSSSGPASSSRANQFDLIPQRSAPLPPDSGGSSSSSSVYIRSGGAAAAAAATSSTASPSTFRSSLEASSGGRLPSNGMSPPIRSGFPVASSGLPSGYAVSSGGPPRPIRSQTFDMESDSGASGFLPASSRSHASVGGPAPSPHLSSPYQSPRFPAAWDTTGLSNSIEDIGQSNNTQSAPATPAASSQSQFLKSNSNSNASRGVGSGPDAGRNTFKAVFGGFVNTIGGESLYISLN